MGKHIKYFRELFEDATSVSVPETLLNDIEQIRDHCNKILLKAYAVKIEGFTYSSSGNNGVTFLGSPFVGKNLGIFGTVVSECNVVIKLDLDEQVAKGAIKLEWEYKSGSKGSSTIGEYMCKDGKILFFDIDDSGEVIKTDPQEIGVSEYGVPKSSIDISDTGNTEDEEDDDVEKF